MKLRHVLQKKLLGERKMQVGYAGHVSLPLSLLAIFCGLLVIRLKKTDKVVDGKKNTDGFGRAKKSV